MNNKLFKFISGEQSNYTGDSLLGTAVNALNDNESKSDVLLPIETGKPIDVVKDFKWTKTRRNSEGRKNTPTVSLEEFRVVVPSFFSNLNVVQQILQTTGTGVIEALKSVAAEVEVGESVTSLIEEGGKALGRNVDSLMEESRKVFGAQEMTMPRYLKAYENLYGVKRTRFKYNLPYLEDKYKNVDSGWSGGSELQSLMGSGKEFIENFFGTLAPGVGIDYAKSYDYGGGPSHDISFFLDNTLDSEYGGYAQNFRLIYLLLYQNLPNRINKITFVPPVIYRAALPGVFSYRWSFLKKIEVNMVGVRRTKTIDKFINEKPSQVVIPEGYEVKMTLQSLVPETQNLYYDAFNTSVVATEE